MGRLSAKALCGHKYDVMARRYCVLRSKPMWVLIYIFSYSVSPAATTDKAEWRLLPSVVFQEFSSSAPNARSKSDVSAA
jgi:hypothetical protein